MKVNSKNILLTRLLLVLLLNGDILFEVVGIRAYPAKKRAEKISNVIEDLAADDTVDINNIQLKRMTDRVEIVYGDRLIFSVFEISQIFVF